VIQSSSIAGFFDRARLEVVEDLARVDIVQLVDERWV